MSLNCSNENWTESSFTSKLTPEADICVGLAILSVALLSILGNGLVLAIYYRRRTKLCSSQILCANLAVVDFFSCIFFYPFPIVSSFNHAWLGENITCVYYGLGCFIFGLCGMFTITAISIVRYLKTCVVYSVWLESINIRLICVAIWLVATVWSCFPLFGWGEYVPEPYGLSCTVAWRGYHTSAKDAFYVICSFTFFTLVPVILIVVSQCMILYKVSRFSYLLSARGIRNKLRYTEKRLSMMFFFSSLGFIIAWAPYAVVSFLYIFHKEHRYMAPEGFVFPALFAKSSHIYNPFIYFYFNKTFQRELLSLIMSLCPKFGANRVGAHVSKSNPAPYPIHIQLQERNRAGPWRKHKNSSKSKESVISKNHGRQVYVCWGSTPKMVASSRGRKPGEKSQSASL